MYLLYAISFSLGNASRRCLTCNSTNDPFTAPATPQDVTISFEKGIPVKLTSEGKEYTDSLELFIALNHFGKIHGIGRIDIVEVCTKTSPCSKPVLTAIEPLHRY